MTKKAPAEKAVRDIRHRDRNVIHVEGEVDLAIVREVEGRAGERNGGGVSPEAFEAASSHGLRVSTGPGELQGNVGRIGGKVARKVSRRGEVHGFRGS